MDPTKSEQLLKAFDSATTNGKFISLNEEQASQFIDQVVDQSKLLKAARVEKMSKPTKTIAKLLDDGEFLKPSRGRSSDEVDAYEFGSDDIELVSKEVTGNIMVYDQDIQDNIEGAGLTNHLLGIITKKIANELETAGMLGIKKTTPVTIRDMFDGFRKRILDDGNVVDANSSALFSGAQRTIAKAKWTKAFKALPTKYRNANIQFFSGSDTMIDYAELFDSSFNRPDFINNILGRPHIDIPLMPIDLPVATATASTTTTTSSAAGQKVLNVTASTNFANGQYVVIGLGTAYEQVATVDTTGSGTITMVANLAHAIPGSLALTVTTAVLDGTDSIISDPKNMIYGIQTEGMSFETYRVPNKGFRYFYKARLDFQVEEPLAAVVLKNLRNN